jgi:hypothetical protein
MTSPNRQFRFDRQTGVYTTGAIGWAHDFTCDPYNYQYGLYYQVLYANFPQQLFEDDLSFKKDWALEIRLKIKDETINLGQSLVEYRQSARMFASAARGIVNAWKSFKKLKPKRRKLTMCDVAASELIYSYGVAPLVSDVYDSVEALKLRLSHPVYRKYFFQQSARLGITIDDTNRLLHANAKLSERINAYVEFDLEKASLFKLGNPLELIWEVIPYSFVVDWMIPVGDYLTSLDALSGVGTVKASRTEKFKYGHKEWPRLQTEWGEIQSTNPGTNSYESFRRTIYDTIPLPSPPKWNPSSSWHAVANGLALLVQGRGCKGRTPVVKF